MTPEQEGERFELINDMINKSLHVWREGLTTVALDNLMRYLSWRAIPEIARLCEEEDDAEEQSEKAS